MDLRSSRPRHRPTIMAPLRLQGVRGGNILEDGDAGGIGALCEDWQG